MPPVRTSKTVTKKNTKNNVSDSSEEEVLSSEGDAKVDLKKGKAFNSDTNCDSDNEMEEEKSNPRNKKGRKVMARKHKNSEDENSNDMEDMPSNKEKKRGKAKTGSLQKKNAKNDEDKDENTNDEDDVSDEENGKDKLVSKSKHKNEVNEDSDNNEEDEFSESEKTKVTSKKNKNNSDTSNDEENNDEQNNETKSNKRQPNKRETRKSTRKLNPYQEYLQERIKELHIEKPGLKNTEYMKIAANEWETKGKKGEKSNANSKDIKATPDKNNKKRTTTAPKKKPTKMRSSKGKQMLSEDNDG